MIKHIILAVNAGFYAANVSGVTAGEAGFLEDTGTAIMLKENDTNESIFSVDLSFKYKNMVTVFPLPPRRRDFLSVTCYPLSELVKGGPRTNVVFTPNDTIYLPNKVSEFGLITSTTVDPDGKIIPGIYGFMLVKKNVNFNYRNKWYIEVIVKEDTSYSDFADILDARFKEIDPALSLVYDTDKFILSTSNVTDKAYDLMFDDLAKFAFTKVSSNGVNNRARHFLRKLCREADANYGFNYTTVEGTELYKNRTDETFKLLEDAILGATPGTLYALNIKFNEPSYYRTIDEKVNKVITIVGDYILIDALIRGLDLTLDNDLKTGNTGNEESNRMIGDTDNNGAIDIADVNALINVILRKVDPSDDDDLTYWDVNGDGTIDVDDVNFVINYILKRTGASIGNVGTIPSLSARLTERDTNPLIVDALEAEVTISDTYVTSAMLEANNG